MLLQYMKQLSIYSFSATSLKSTLTVHAKPEVITAAESTMHNLFIHNGLTFHKYSPVLFIHTLLNMP